MAQTALQPLKSKGTPPWDMGRKRERQHNGHWVTGSILIGIGSLFLLDRLDYLNVHRCVTIGLSSSPSWVSSAWWVRAAQNKSPKAVLVFLGFWLYAPRWNMCGAFSFHNSWPMILASRPRTAPHLCRSCRQGRRPGRGEADMSRQRTPRQRVVFGLVLASLRAASCSDNWVFDTQAVLSFWPVVLIAVGGLKLGNARRPAS